MSRKPNFFEKALLIVGAVILMTGYGLIHHSVVVEGFTIQTIQTIFLWLALVILIIIAAVNENMKEELKQVVELHLQEIRMLRHEIRKK